MDAYLYTHCRSKEQKASVYSRGYSVCILLGQSSWSACDPEEHLTSFVSCMLFVSWASVEHSDILDYNILCESTIPGAQQNYKICCTRIVKKCMSVSRQTDRATASLVYSHHGLRQNNWCLSFTGNFKRFFGLFFPTSLFSLVLTPPQVQLCFVTEASGYFFL